VLSCLRESCWEKMFCTMALENLSPIRAEGTVLFKGIMGGDYGEDISTGGRS